MSGFETDITPLGPDEPSAGAAPAVSSDDVGFGSDITMLGSGELHGQASLEPPRPTKPTPGAPDGAAFDVDVRSLRLGDGVLRRYALVIGVDDYRDPDLRLRYCVDDAVRLAAVLKTRGYQVAELRDPRSAAEVVSALEAVLARADEDDIVLLYFSGHGRRIGDKPYLLLADTPNSDDGIAQHGLALARVLEILRGVPRWVTVFLDACRMGLGLDPEASKSTSHNLERDGCFALLSGSTSDDITQDAADGAGIFSSCLIDGLAGAAADSDGVVWFSALAQHVQHGVSRWRDSRDGEAKLSTQRPVLRLEVADVAVLPPNAYREIISSPVKILAATFAPDGHLLVTASEDSMVWLWDPATRKQLTGMTLDGGYAAGLAFAPHGHCLAIAVHGGAEGLLVLWQFSGQTHHVEMPLPKVASAVAWSPDGRLAAASGNDIHVFTLDELARPIPQRVLTGHADRVTGLAFARDGQLISGSTDRTVRTWNVDTGACSNVLPHDGPIWAIAVSPDGRYIAAGGIDDAASETLHNLPCIWDRTTQELVTKLSGHTAGVTAIVYNQTGDRLATTSLDGRARVWCAHDPDVRNRGRLLRQLTVDVEPHALAPEAYAAAFSPSGKQLFVGFADGRGRLFALAPRVERVPPSARRGG
jgi:WD40 repeat protein